MPVRKRSGRSRTRAQEEVIPLPNDDFRVSLSPVPKIRNIWFRRSGHKKNRLKMRAPAVIILVTLLSPCAPFSYHHPAANLFSKPCRSAGRVGTASASAPVAAAANEEEEETAAAAAEPVVVTTLHPANQYLEIRLNRPAKFNSLDTEMLTLIRDALDAHAAELKGVILSAALGGRAFSAGGDIKHVAALPDAAARVDFLHLEYSVHQRLHALAHGTGPDPQVPVIAVGDGIVMGAGAGLFMAASERLVTERTLFAMPECKIGLVPDAGALHFLRHPATILAPSVGRMLALTGTRLRARDLLYAKLATDFLPAASVPALLDDLSRCPPGEHRAAFDRRRDPSMGGGDALKGLDQGVLEAARGAIDTAFGEEEEEKEEEEEGETGREEKKDDDEEEPPLVFPLNDDGTGSSSSGSTSSSSSSNGVAALVGRLEAARAAADGVVNGGSAGWRTREAAEQALELATEALAALTDDLRLSHLPRRHASRLRRRAASVAAATPGR